VAGGKLHGHRPLHRRRPFRRTPPPGRRDRPLAPGHHDWENILGTLGLLRYDQTLGALSYAVGRLLMLAAFAWGGYVLVRQYRNRVRG